MNSSRYHPAAFWITVALVAVLVGYLLSFGPACWWFATRPTVFFGRPSLRAHRQYWSIGWLAQNGPGPVGDAIFWYAKLGLRCDNIEIPADMAGVDTYDSSSHVLAWFLECRRMAQ
jgi:hypothetical protein